MKNLYREGAGRLAAAFVGGALVGALGGLVGLGGAEFRLPLLLAVFGFAALQAVILNKAMSLVVVTAALFFRSTAVPLAEVAAHWTIMSVGMPRTVLSSSVARPESGGFRTGGAASAAVAASVMTRAARVVRRR
ncbi:hypothetical protein LJR296_007597 [Cupriavidus necator]|uniref:hypothetical protein n=1 Tax=Cupriavidus necator TaxID=106590 RepID=UPI003ECE357A